MDIYLDTNLWNALRDQAVDPKTLLVSLAANNATLVLSDENIYELAKTFLESGKEGPLLGATLFSYLREFSSETVRLSKDNMSLLAAEMHSLKWQMSYIYPFLDAGNSEIVRAEIEKLSVGEVSERVQKHIAWRIAAWESERAGIIRHFQELPALKQALKNIPVEQLTNWLFGETKSEQAVAHLAWQIRDYFPEAPANEANEYAQALLVSPHCQIAKALVRRNFYFNWRLAHRRSLRKDLFCDSNHILNSTYCDVYATKEAGQTEYAGLLLTSATKIAVYDCQMRIDEWLLALTETTVPDRGHPPLSVS